MRVRPSSVPHGGEEGKARVVKGRGKKRKYEDSTFQAPSLLRSLDPTTALVVTYPKNFGSDGTFRLPKEPLPGIWLGGI